jgi:hypothetical protein
VQNYNTAFVSEDAMADAEEAFFEVVVTPRGTPRAQSPPPVGELASAPHDADEKGKHADADSVDSSVASSVGEPSVQVRG